MAQRLDDGVYRWDGEKAERAISFIEHFCRHNKGKLGGQLLKLQLWQKAFVSLLFGVMAPDGLRQFREVILVVGRKCGKTLLAAAIMCYVAYVDGEYGSEIYCLAPKLDQTALVYDAFWYNTQNNESLKGMIRSRKADFIIDSTNTTIK